MIQLRLAKAMYFMLILDGRILFSKICGYSLDQLVY